MTSPSSSAGRGLSLREKWLLMTLVFIALPLGWWCFRWAPGRKQLVELESKTSAARQGLENAHARLAAAADTTLSRSSLARQRAELDSLHFSADRVRTDLEIEEGRFVALDSPAATSQLRLDLSVLAARHDLRVLERSDIPRGTVEIPTWAGPLCGGSDSRPLHQVTVRSAYASICAFIDDLGTLPSRVTLVTLRIDSDRDLATGAHLGSVTTTLVLAL